MDRVGRLIMQAKATYLREHLVLVVHGWWRGREELSVAV